MRAGHCCCSEVLVLRAGPPIWHGYGIDDLYIDGIRDATTLHHTFTGGGVVSQGKQSKHATICICFVLVYASLSFNSVVVLRIRSRA